MKNLLILWLFILSANGLYAQAINATTYPFTIQSGVAPEDMSSGTNVLIGPASDNGSAVLQNIGFDFYFYGTAYTQYSISANGYIKLGSLISSPGTASDFTNSLGSFNQFPCIAPYWDDLRTGINTGKVHVKTIGIAPNRKLIVEWFDMEIPKLELVVLRNFQLWLSETTGKIEFVYGRPGVDIPSNSNTSGASIGFNRFGTAFASVSSATNTVSYTTANNGNVAAIDAGTKYTFTPNIPNGPTNFNFTNVGGLSMTLNWTDNATNEIGYAIYRSDDGGNTYPFFNTTNANAVSFTQVSLQPNTPYFWKILAYTEGGLSDVLVGSQSTAAISNLASNGTGGGNWSNPATWENGIVPTDALNVTIKDGDVVTVDVNANAFNLQVGQGNSGILQFEAVTARTLTVNKSLEIKSGGSILTAASGAVTTHILNVYENLVNNGTLDLAGATTGAALRFLGNANSNFTGNGSITDVFGLTISKGSLSQVTEMDIANFSVRGLAANANSGFLTLTSGTLKISGSNAFSGTFSAGTPFWTSSASFWLNNPNFTIQGQSGNVNISGGFRLSAGVFNAGTSINNTLTLGASNFLIEGGVLNIAGRCSTNVFIQTGGLVNICTVGNNTTQPSFEMPAGTFSQTGGILKLVKLNSNATAANRKDYFCNASTTNFTNGKLVVGELGSTTAVGGTYLFLMNGITPSMEIVSTNATNAGVSLNGNLSTYGNVLINESSGVRSANFNWTIFDATLTNNGTIIHSGSSTRLTFGGIKTPCTYMGTGIAGNLGVALSNLVIDNSTGLIIDATTTNNLIVGNLQLAIGSITNANKITLGIGGSSSSTVTIGFSGAIVAPGNLDALPTFNIGSNGLRLEYLGPALNRSMGNEIPANRIIHLLTLNNGGANLTMSGGNLQVNSGLVLTTGKINLNGDSLTVGTSTASPGSVTAGSGSFIYNGKLKQWVPNNSNTARIFPMGTLTAKRNASIAFTTFPTTGGTLTTEWISEDGGSNGLPLVEGVLPVNSTAVDGFWRINAADGLDGGLYTATLTANSIADVGTVSSVVMVKRNNNASAWQLNGNHITSAGNGTNPVLSRTAMSGFSEFGIGLPSAASPLNTTWNGSMDTDWFNASNWSNGVPGAPTAVTIPASLPRYPVISADTSIKSMNIQQNASVTLANNIKLILLGQL